MGPKHHQMKSLCTHMGLWGRGAAAAVCAHSLVGNASENDVVQQGYLLSQLHGRQGLEALGLRTVGLQEMRAGNGTHLEARRPSAHRSCWSSKSTPDSSSEEHGRELRDIRQR